jgi:hypothetical protein
VVIPLQFFNRTRYRARARPRPLMVAGEKARKDEDEQGGLGRDVTLNTHSLYSGDGTPGAQNEGSTYARH